MRRRERRTYALTFLVASALAAMPAAAVNNTPVAPPAATIVTGSVKVPLVRVGGLPALSVSINGSRPYPFIIDWAANVLAISPDRAQGLKLPKFGADAMGNTMVSIADLAVGRAHFRGLTAAEDPFLNGRVETGVLGVNVYRNAIVTIDFTHNMVTIEQEAPVPANGRDILAYTSADGGAPLIPITVCGTRLSVNIDTAAAASVRLPRTMIDSLGCKAHVLGGDSVVGAQSGRARVINARIDGDVRIANLTFTHPIVRFGDGPVAFVGGGLLNKLSLRLDQRHHLIRIGKP